MRRTLDLFDDDGPPLRRRLQEDDEPLQPWETRKLRALLFMGADHKDGPWAARAAGCERFAHGVTPEAAARAAIDLLDKQ